MIDWLSIATSALWIIGGAIGLAAISYAHWEAQMRGEKLRVVLAHQRTQNTLNVAALFFCVGLLASVSQTWERVLWGILVLAFGSKLVAMRDGRKQ